MCKKHCSNCKWAVSVDYGYSNYTVEGSEVYCIQKEHPEDGYDRWYGHSKEGEYASSCEMHTSGEPIDIDVEREGGDFINYVEDIEVKGYLMLLGVSLEDHLGID